MDALDSDAVAVQDVDGDAASLEELERFVGQRQGAMFRAYIDLIARHGWLLILAWSESASPATVPTVPNLAFCVDVETGIATLFSSSTALRAGDLVLDAALASEVNHVV